MIAGRDSGTDRSPAAPRAKATPVPDRACDRKATSGATLVMEFAEAKPGQTICLASGRYGTFRAGVKGDTVTVRSAPGAKARLAVDWDGVRNVRLERVIVTGLNIRGASRDIAIARSRFTGLAVVNADRMADANVVFDGNTHKNIDTCITCFQGRLHIEGNSGRPSGVVVRNSVFSGGNSDGVRADANGLHIVGNEFFGLRDQDPFHTDPVQIFGGTNVVIRGNYIHDNHVSAGIMMADGGRGNVVEDNVITGEDMTWAITWMADRGSTIAHNTLVDGSCDFGVRCGFINLGAKTGDPRGRGTVIRDNVLGGISNSAGGQESAFVAEHNLTRSVLPGSANVEGEPAYKGPLDSYRGHRLTGDSPGKRSASDGGDVGIRGEPRS